MPSSALIETVLSAVKACTPSPQDLTTEELNIPDDIITSFGRKSADERKAAYTWLGANLSPIDPDHNHALLARLSVRCKSFLVDAALQVKQCIVTTMLTLFESEAWLEATAFEIVLPRMVRAYLSDTKCGLTLTSILHTVAMKKGLDGPVAVLTLVMVEIENPTSSWGRLFIERGVDALVSLLVNFSPCTLKHPGIILGPITQWCREDLLSCRQLHRTGEKLARCLCGYGGESMRDLLLYNGSYEPAIPPIIRVDGIQGALLGGGIRLDVSVLAIAAPKGSSPTVQRQSVEKRPMKASNVASPARPELHTRKPIGAVLDIPPYIVAEQLLNPQWGVRMEALTSIKSALTDGGVSGLSIVEELGSSLSAVVEKETHKACLSLALNVVCLAVKADPLSKPLLRSLGMVTANRLADRNAQVNSAARSCHEVWVNGMAEEWWKVVCEGILSGSGRRTAASSELKARLLQLLGERANSGKTIPCDVLPALLTKGCLTDRHAGLRSSSERLLRYLLPTANNKAITVMLESLTASERQALRPVLSRVASVDSTSPLQRQEKTYRSVGCSNGSRVPASSEMIALQTPIKDIEVESADVAADDVLLEYIGQAPRIPTKATSAAEGSVEVLRIQLRPAGELQALRVLRDKEACTLDHGRRPRATEERQKEVKRQFETQVLKKRGNETLLDRMFSAAVDAEDRCAVVQLWNEYVEANPHQCESFVDLLVQWMVVTASDAAESSQLRRCWDGLADRVADCELPKPVAAELLAWLLTKSRGLVNDRGRKVALILRNATTIKLVTYMLRTPLCSQGVTDLIQLAADCVDDEPLKHATRIGLCRAIIARFSPATRAACDTAAKAILERGGERWWSTMQQALRDTHADSDVVKALLLPPSFATKAGQLENEQTKTSNSPEMLPTSLEESLAYLKTLESDMISEGQIQGSRRLLKQLTRVSTFVFNACGPSTDPRIYLAFLKPVEQVVRSPEFWRNDDILKQDLAEFITYMLSPLVNRSLRHVLTHGLDPPCKEVFEKLNHIVIHSVAYYLDRPEAFEALLEVGLRDRKFVPPVVRCIDKLTRKGMLPQRDAQYATRVCQVLLQHTRDLLRRAEHAGEAEVTASDLVMASMLARGHSFDLEAVLELLCEQMKDDITPSELTVLRAVCDYQLQ